MTRIQLGSAAAGPGHKAWGQLRVAQGKKDVRLPVAVIHGARPGPHVVMMANQHGDELNGFEAIRQFVEQVDPRQFKGTVFAILSMNPRAAMLKSAVWPESRHAQLVRKFGDGPYHGVPAKKSATLNMNRIWPGKPNGSLAERIDHEIWTRAILDPHRKANLVIDIHSFPLGYRTPVFVADDTQTQFGVATGIPYIVNMRWSLKHEVRTIGAVAREEGIPALTLEPAGQNCIVPESVEETRVALFNMVKLFKMLPGPLRLPTQSYIMDPWRSNFEKTPRPSQVTVNAPCAGLLAPYKRQYDFVKLGDPLCNLCDIYTGKVLKTFRAPHQGMLYHMNLGGICAKGDRLFIVTDVQTIDPAKMVGAMRGRLRL